MSKAAGGLRDRRRRDVLELLARARPASLDPGQSGPPAQQAAARLAAADGASRAGPAVSARGTPSAAARRTAACSAGSRLWPGSRLAGRARASNSSTSRRRRSRSPPAALLMGFAPSDG